MLLRCERCDPARDEGCVSVCAGARRRGQRAAQPAAAPPRDQLTSLDRRKCPHGVDQVGDYANVLVDVPFCRKRLLRGHCWTSHSWHQWTIKLWHIGTSQQPISATCRDIDLMQTTSSRTKRGPISTAKVFKMKANKLRGPALEITHERMFRG
jgi:hypothetical protein